MSVSTNEDESRADDPDDDTDDEDSIEEWEVNAWRWLWWPIIGSAAILGVNALLAFVDKERGSYGDIFGGSAALFSAVAFVALIYSLALQRREGRMQRKELELQRKELRMQRDELKSQRMEHRESRAALAASAEQQRLQSLFELDALIQRHRSETVQVHVRRLIATTAHYQPLDNNGRIKPVSESVNFLDSYFEGIAALLSAWSLDLEPNVRAAVVLTVAKDAAVTSSALDIMVQKTEEFFGPTPTDKSGWEAAQSLLVQLRSDRPHWTDLGSASL